MLDHIKNQPLYITLRQYRVMAIVSLVFLGYMMHDAWVFFVEQHTLLSTEGVAGYFTYVAALLAAFIKSVNNIQGKHEE